MPDQLDPAQTVSAPQNQLASAASSGDETAAASNSSGADAPHFAAPAAPGEVGTLGPYRVVKQLGAGGMGAVYLALDTRLDRKLALKVMLPAFAADANAKERFLREARAAARISHDNVVTVFEADERDGVPYIAMQYLQGYPLDEFLKNKGVPALPHVIRIARETALGLAAAHAFGLVHRDIKPANLWLEAPNGRVKVLDFGLAKPIGSDTELTKSGAVVGTPAYMSPEQARGQKVDHRTDLFSLGGVLYRLCTGKSPFSGPNVMAVLMALGTKEPTPVRELNPNIPEPLAALVHQLLAKKADDRPQTAAEVAKRLRAILEQLVAAPKGSGSGTAQPVVSPPSASSADISNSLPVVVHPLPHQPPIVVPMQITAQPESAFANLGEVADDATEVAPASTSGAKPKRKKTGGKWPLLAAGAAALAALVIVAGVVVIKIKNKDGTETEIKVPDGATVTIEKGGKKVAEVGPNQPKPAPKTEAVVRLPPKAWAPPAAIPVGQSPFDKLDPKEITAAERFDWQPKELVAVAGTHSPRTWARMAGGFAVSPDGSLVATGGQHTALRVWDVKTRALKADLRGYEESVATFAPDGKSVFAYSYGNRPYHQWDLAKPDMPARWTEGPSSAANYHHGLWISPDSSVAVTHGETDVSVWDLKAQPAKRLSKFPMGAGKLTAVATPDATRMAHYSDDEKAVLVHDIAPAGVTERCRLEVPLSTLAISADGTRLVTTHRQAKRRLWNLTANPPTFVEFDEPITDGASWQMAFSPDGKRLATPNHDSLRLWDTTGATPKEVWAKPFPVFGLNRETTRLGFAGEGWNTLVAFTGLGLVHFIDVSRAEPKWLNPIEPTEPAGGGITIDGATGRVSLARAADQRFQWWDFAKAKPTPVDVVAPAGTVASTPDGGKHAVWDAKTETLSLVVGGKPAGPLTGVHTRGVFAADGRTYWGLTFPSGDNSNRDGVLKCWDVSGAAPRETHSITLTATAHGGPQRLGLHRNDTVLACHYADQLTFWDLTADEPRLLSTFPSPTISRPHVFPDGERVLTFDRGITPQLWQATTKGWVKVWENAAAGNGFILHSGWTTSAGAPVYGKCEAAHPSGQWFALYARDELTIRLSSDGSVVQKFPLKAPPYDLEFAPDGRHLFVANGFNTVYVLRLPDFANTTERTTAEQVLSSGGTVRLNGDARVIKTPTELPKEWFAVTAVVLSGKSFTDASLVRLKPLTALAELDLSDTSVTDAGLDHLAGLDKLVSLRLPGTKVTAAGVAKLAKALPGCKIEWDGGTVEPKP